MARDEMKQRIAQRRWYLNVVKQRREKWFKENGPCRKCGLWEDLELDHKNKTTKISHNIWSWSKERREKELLKCQPLCSVCHKAKTKAEGPQLHRIQYMEQ